MKQDVLRKKEKQKRVEDMDTRLWGKRGGGGERKRGRSTE